jgi:hypothetical protein
METKIDFLRWLSTKLYLVNAGFYATICAVMILPAFFANALGASQLPAYFMAFFIVSFLRAAYESVVIYESPVKNLSLTKMLILTCVTSGTMTLITYFLKPRLGYFSIPVALIISMMIVGKLKAALWPLHERPGFFSELPAKLGLLSTSRYLFFGFLVGIAYYTVGIYGFNFPCSFATAYFMGMMLEELYNVVKLYEQPLTTRGVIAMILWAACCSVLSTIMIVTMMKFLGFSGQAATITIVILVKLVQPIGSRKFIYQTL